MKREDMLKFTNSVILLSKLFTKIEDRFLKQKLHEKISDFVSAFIEQRTNPTPTSHEYRFYNVDNVVKSDDIVQRSANVAQYHHRELLHSINNLLDYLEYLTHISENDTIPLLATQRNLLKFKLHVLKKSKTGGSAIPDIAPTVANFSSEIPVTADVAISKPLVRARPARLVLKSDSNKERIFNFIKKTPDVRAKDVMSKFSALSGRTVKRSLKELTDEGFLKKRSDGGAVYYFVIN